MSPVKIIKSGCSASNTRFTHSWTGLDPYLETSLSVKTQFPSSRQERLFRYHSGIGRRLRRQQRRSHHRTASLQKLSSCYHILFLLYEKNPMYHIPKGSRCSVLVNPKLIHLIILSESLVPQGILHIDLVHINLHLRITHPVGHPRSNLPTSTYHHRESGTVIME